VTKVPKVVVRCGAVPF